MFVWNKNDKPNDDGAAHRTPDHFPYDLIQGSFLPGPLASAPPSTAPVLSLMHLVNCAKHKGKNSILTAAGNHLMPWSMKFDYPYLSLSLNQKNVARNTGSELHLWNDIGQSAEISECPFSFLISAHCEDLLQTGKRKKKPLLLGADFISLSTLSWASQEAFGSQAFSLWCRQKFLIYQLLACPHKPWSLEPCLYGNLHSGYTTASFLKVWSRDKSGHKSTEVFVKNVDSCAP